MTKTFWRVVVKVQFDITGWTITQKEGTVFGPLISLGWMKEPPRLVPENQKPLYAFQSFFGPIALAVGWVPRP